MTRHITALRRMSVALLLVLLGVIALLFVTIVSIGWLLSSTGLTQTAWAVAAFYGVLLGICLFEACLLHAIRQLPRWSGRPAQTAFALAAVASIPIGTAIDLYSL